MRQIVLIGYEGQDLDSLVGELTAGGVEVVADVRLNAISRRRVSVRRLSGRAALTVMSSDSRRA